MTDIVRRLRASPLGGLSEPVLRHEAADEIEQLRAACELFTEAAHDARDALNNAGIACPASIAFAAEKARAALKPKP